MFDNICLSKFITDSDNAKKLDEEERERLKNLLILYRNIRFFPKSQEDKRQGEWEIFPVNEERDVKNRIDDYKNKIKAIQNEKKNNNDNKNSYVIKEMEELKSMLEKYPEESLERKVIEEEIMKIRQKTN
jgi:GH25 family lysozyme M1 (1,4-beta-N-acetylmuramidase)